jgi:starch synthase (maltosyl-transferring)
VGSVRNWSGLDDPNGQSWLLEHAADLKFNAIWFSPMTQATGVEKKIHGKVLTGSYYATRNHFALDADSSCGDAEKDKDHLKNFAKLAKARGITLYADLVFNHVAADHPLVAEEDKEIAEIRKKSGGNFNLIRGHKNKLIGVSWNENGQEHNFHFKFRRNDDLKLQFGGPPEDPWTDAAQVNYSSPEGRRFFVEGDANHKGYWKQVIDWHLDNGFTGFRCDAAYLIPPESWEELISYTKARQPGAVFMAETLCQDMPKVERMANATIIENGKERPAFDLGMLGFYWWDLKDGWLPQQEHPRVQKMSKFGGAGSPDTHDTETTVAGGIRKAFNHAARASQIEAEVSVREYAAAALASNSSYMQMGYEFCNEKQNSVFRGQVSEKDWNDLVKNNKGKTPDISDKIRAINELKENLHVENCRVEFKEHSAIQDGKLIKIRVEYIDVDTNQKTAELVLIVNQKPENGAVKLTDGGLLHHLEKSGFEKLQPGVDAASGAPFINDVLIFHTPIAKTPAKTPAVAPNRKPPPPALAA